MASLKFKKPGEKSSKEGIKKAKRDKLLIKLAFSIWALQTFLTFWYIKS